MKTSILVILCTIAMSYGATAQTAPGANEEFGKANPGAIQAAKDQMVKDAANLVCHDSLCQLFEVKVRKQSFTITTYVGNRQPGMMNGGTNNYYGSNPMITNYDPNQVGYGVQVTWDNTKCTKTIMVDKSVYDSVTTYMAMLVNTKPGEDKTFPQFTPAEETMILFYTTVMELTKGQTCG